MANRYVRAGASGANDGTDWTNAYTTLPSSLTRGDTYYIADGSYSGYNFDDSGTTLTTIKKATIADHGTSTGWDNAYGDGTAEFGLMHFTTSGWLFDGQTRNESDWNNQTAYGFEIDGGTGGSNKTLVNLGTDATNITIRYTNMHYTAALVGTPDESANRDEGISGAGNEDVTIEYCRVAETSWKAAILMVAWDGAVIRYCRFENIFKKELISSGAGGPSGASDNIVFAFNQMRNIAGTGAIQIDSCNNWEIYGNWLDNPSSDYEFSDTIFGTWTGDHVDRTETNNNILVYNNTFYRTQGGARVIAIQNGTGNIARNNLAIGSSVGYSGAITTSDNDNLTTTAVVDAANQDFHLVGATSPGTTLSSPYDVDMDGVTRGADGTWDVGAFEYDEGGGSPEPARVCGFLLTPIT